MKIIFCMDKFIRAISDTYAFMEDSFLIVRKFPDRVNIFSSHYFTSYIKQLFHTSYPLTKTFSILKLFKSNAFHKIKNI